MNFESLKTDYNKFCTFLKSNKIILILNFIFTIMSYGCLLFYYRLSIDNEYMITNYNGTLSWHILLGRFTNVIIKKIVDTGMFHPFVAAFLTVVIIYLFSVLWTYLIYYFSGEKNNKYLWVFPILFLTFPTFAEQFTFLMQSFEVGLAICACAISLYCISNWVLLQKDKKYLFIGIFFMVFSFGSYQALFTLYIAGAFTCFISFYMAQINDNKVFKKGFFKNITIKYTSSYIAGVILYYVISKIMIMIFRRGDTTSYLGDQIHWKTAPVSETIKVILDYMRDMTLSNSYFSSKIFLIAGTVILSYAVFNIFKKRKGAYFFLLTIIGLLLSPFLTNIVLGSNSVPRVQLQMPLVAAYSAYTVLIILKNIKLKYLKSIIIVFYVIIAMRQGQITSQLFYSDYIRYQQDVLLAHKIGYKIENLGLGEKPEYSVAIIGKHSPNIPKGCIKGESIGSSFFDFYPGETWETTDRVNSFMNSLGYDYKFPSDKEMDKAREISEDMPNWPDPDSVIFKDDLIVVRLSESIRS